MTINLMEILEGYCYTSEAVCTTTCGVTGVRPRSVDRTGLPSQEHVVGHAGAMGAIRLGAWQLSDMFSCHSLLATEGLKSGIPICLVPVVIAANVREWV